MCQSYQNRWKATQDIVQKVDVPCKLTYHHVYKGAVGALAAEAAALGVTG